MQRTGLRRDELTTLADIGALNTFTNERRSALWQVERSVRPAGELFAGHDANSQGPTPNSQGSETKDQRPETARIPTPNPEARYVPWIPPSACRQITRAWA